MLSEEEVRKSFARVKEDILQIKRSLNKQVFSVEEINKSIGNALEKQEFYAFIKRLGSKVEELESSFPAKSDKEDVDELAVGLRDEIAALRKLLQQRDDLAGEVREVRSLKGKMLELEGSAVSRADFSKDATKLRSDLASVKASASATGKEMGSLSDSLSSSLSKLGSNFADLSAKLNSLTVKAVDKDDIAAFTERVELSHQETQRGFSVLQRDVDKKTAFASNVEEKLSAFSEKLAESEDTIAEIGEAVSKKLVDKPEFERSISELQSKLNDAQKLLESSVSEVNLDDYVTKRSLKQQLSSFSESVSAVPSRMGDVEEQLQSLKSELESARKNVQKQLGRESQKFAAAKDVESVREELEKVSSSFVPSGDFYSKFDRLEGSSAKAFEDFKREIKRQRELFEEHLKSLESYYRSSNDTLKAEVDMLRSSIKALSKADEHAKAEMAKISTSAAKVAARTAADLIEEAEEDAKEDKKSRRGKGLSPLAVSVIIIALLLIGSVSYVFLKGGEKAPVQTLENVTPQAAVKPAPSPTQAVVPPMTNKSIPSASPSQQPSQPQQPATQPKAPVPAPAPSNATNATAPASNASAAPAAPKQNASQNVTTNVLPVQNASNVSKAVPQSAAAPVKVPANVSFNLSSNVSSNLSSNVSSNLSAPEASSANVSANVTKSNAPDKNRECKEKLDCKEGAPGEYGFDCYFDNATSQCRCYVSTGENCPGVNASKAAKANVSSSNATNMSAVPGKAKSAGARYYGIVAFVVLVVGFFAYRALFVREDGKGKKEKADKPDKTAKAHEKPKAGEDKAAAKAEVEEDDDVIDLEEFFEKKESKKK